MDTLGVIIVLLIVVAIAGYAVRKHRAKNSGPTIPGGPHPHDGSNPPSDVDKV